MALLGSAAIWLALPAMPALAQDSSATLLDEVWLGKSKREVQTDTATATTSIAQEELADRQAGTIAQLIDSVPGVALVNGNSPHGSGINIRGFGANGTYGSDQKVRIQIDNSDVGAEELYRIGTQLYTDPSLYKVVEVVRGMAGTFEYGSGAVGGLVRLETKDAADFTGGEPGAAIQQTLQGSTNGGGLSSSTILAWQPSAQLEILGNYTRSRQDDVQDGDGNTIGNSAYDLPSWLLKAKYRFGAGQSLTLSMTDTHSQERDVPYDTFQTTSGNFGNVDRDIHSRTATLAYNLNPENNALLDLDVILSYADQQIDQSYVPGSSPLEGTSIFGRISPLVNADHRYETTKLTLKNTALFDTGAFGHTLRAGVELIRKDRLEASSAPGGTDQRLAVFVVDDLTMGGLTLTPSVRFETQKIGDDTDSYRNEALMGGLSALYRWDNGLSVFGSAAYSENLPIIDDMTTPAYMTQSEKARSVELGFAYDRFDAIASGDTLALKVNAYKTRLGDVTSYSGITDVTVEGLELEASYAMDSGLYVDLNANVVKGTVTAPTAQYWDNAPADTIQATFGRKWHETLDLSWEVVHHLKMDRVNDAADATGAQTVHNLRATYRPDHGALKGTELRVGLENVFDLDYQPHLATYDAPGRNLKFTLTKLF
jgi:hemoglobin/transferrin/lactoferrin receptor protein